MRIERKKEKMGSLRRSRAVERVTPCAPLAVHRLLRFAGSLFAVFCFLIGLAVAADQKPPSSTVKGFQAPLQYFEPPHELQMKSYLEGAQADPGANGVIIIQNAKLQTFREDGVKEMTVKAPQCIFDSRGQTVSSAGPFQMQTSNVMVQGVGFFWKQTNSELLISNQQVTTVTGQMTNSFTP
jgi:hypothetical protein